VSESHGFHRDTHRSARLMYYVVLRVPREETQREQRRARDDPKIIIELMRIAHWLAEDAAVLAAGVST